MAEDKDRERALDLAVSQIEKQFGKGSIMKLGEGALAQNIASISTGSLGSGPRPRHWWPAARPGGRDLRT